MLVLLVSVGFAASIEGSWVMTSRAEQVASAQRASVEQALSGVPSALLPLADRILAPTMKVCGAYRITVPTGQFSVQCDALSPLSLPADGAQHMVQVGGEARPVSVTVQGEVVTLTIHGSEGTRSTRYEPLSNGGMRVSVSILSGHVEQPIRWSVDYGRPPAAP